MVDSLENDLDPSVVALSHKAAGAVLEVVQNCDGSRNVLCSLILGKDGVEIKKVERGFSFHSPLTVQLFPEGCDALGVSLEVEEFRSFTEGDF